MLTVEAQTKRWKNGMRLDLINEGGAISNRLLVLEKAFDRVKQRQDHLRIMIDKIPTPAWSCRSDGATDFLNQRWLDYTGLSMAQALGWGWKVAIHPDDLEALMNAWLRTLASKEPCQEEARLRRFDGEYRWFLFRAEPVRNEHDEVIRWYGTNTDIEDLKRAEDQLRRDERELRRIIDDIPQAVQVLDANGGAD